MPAPTLSDLPEFFRAAHYEQSLARIAAITPPDRAVDPAAAQALFSEVSDAAVLVRVFYLGLPAERDDLNSALAPELCELLLAEGLLLQLPDGRLRAAAALVPARGFWGLRDFDAWATGQPRPDDHVLGVGIASSLLADLTVRRKANRVLDLGTGQGFQAALAARHASSVIATDINPRALQFARLNMRMNNVPNVDLRPGSFFDPVEHEKNSFDLLVSNPPFIISPPHALSAVGGNWIGDAFVQNLIARAHEFLAEDGWATIIGNWHHPTPADWSARPASWLAGKPVDAWIVKLNTDDPRTYAANWLRHESPHAQGGSPLEDWLDYYRSINVGAISMGVFYLRKRTPKPGMPPNWMRSDAFPLDALHGKAGGQAERLFANETLLRSLGDDSAVLDHRLALRPEAELVQRLRPVAGTWKAPDALLRQSEGFEFPIALGPLPAQILARLDGTRPARAVIQDIAAQMNADPNAAYAQSAPFLAQMLRLTHLALAD
jgi:methylase of polypeptide subunit release factors